jgi:hypothetical protein
MAVSRQQTGNDLFSSPTSQSGEGSQNLTLSGPTAEGKQVTASQKKRMEDNKAAALAKIRKRKEGAGTALVFSPPPKAVRTDQLQKSSPSSSSPSSSPSYSKVMLGPRNPVEKSKSVLSTNCKDWSFLFRYGPAFGVQVINLSLEAHSRLSASLSFCVTLSCPLFFHAATPYQLCRMGKYICIL